MVPTSRRTLLRMGITGFTAGIAGCTTLGSSANGDSSVRIGRIDLVNDVPKDRTVSLLVVRDDETLYWERHKLVGDTSSEGEGGIRLTPPDFEAGAGQYTLAMHVEESGESERLSSAEIVDRWNDSDGCYWIIGAIKDVGPTFAHATGDASFDCSG